VGGIKEEMLVNEETGQVVYSNSSTKEKINDLFWGKYNGGSTNILIDDPDQRAKT